MIGARRIERRNSPPNPSQWSRRLDGIRIGGGMAEQHTLTAYTDYKSPYAYLAKDLVYELQRDFPVRIDWLPYRLDIPSSLRSARLDGSCRAAEAIGVFGVPTFVLAGEIFWGREHLPEIREMLGATA